MLFAGETYLKTNAVEQFYCKFSGAQVFFIFRFQNTHIIFHSPIFSMLGVIISFFGYCESETVWTVFHGASFSDVEFRATNTQFEKARLFVPEALTVLLSVWRFNRFLTQNLLFFEFSGSVNWKEAVRLKKETVCEKHSHSCYFQALWPKIPKKMPNARHVHKGTGRQWPLEAKTCLE